MFLIQQVVVKHNNVPHISVYTICTEHESTEYSAHGVGRLKPTKMCNFVFPKSGKIIYTDIVILIQQY